MADINTTTAGAGLTSAGMLTITGGVLGMHFDTLIVGFLAGMVALSFQEKQSYWRMLSTVFSSSMLAGAFAPVWSVVAVHYVPFLSAIGPEAANAASAATIGVTAQALVPVVLGKLKTAVETFTPGAKQ